MDVERGPLQDYDSILHIGYMHICIYRALCKTTILYIGRPSINFHVILANGLEAIEPRKSMTKEVGKAAA